MPAKNRDVPAHAADPRPVTRTPEALGHPSTRQMSMHCRAGQFAGQPFRIALRLPSWLTAGSSAACTFRRRWHGSGKDGPGMAGAGELPFRGSVIWLSPAPGGPATGPPLARPAWLYYAATAHVLSHTADTGLASFILRDFDADAAVPCRGTLAGRRYPRRPAGRAGFCNRRTESARVVACFTVHHVADSGLPCCGALPRRRPAGHERK
jgi:hypothetical protein